MYHGIELEKLLQQRYALPEWVTITEFCGNNRRADLVAFNSYGSRGFRRVAFECKRTRADFLHEIDDPDKRSWLEELFHQTYFVVVPDIVAVDEIPEGWGLLVATKSGDRLIRRKAPKHRQPKPFPEHYMMWALRRVGQQYYEQYSKNYVFQGKEVTQDDINKMVKSGMEFEATMYRDLMRKARVLRNALEDRKRSLETPFKILLREAGKSGVVTERGDYITPGEVRRWIEAIRRSTTREVMEHFWKARDAIDKLEREMRSHDLDTGSPTLTWRDKRRLHRRLVWGPGCGTEDAVISGRR